ncbi:MAG: hypothetical protein AB7U73_12120 [Pirellulales bacterium]
MKSLCNWLTRALLGLAIALTAIGGRLAQAQEEGGPVAPPSDKGYVYQYFLVGLCIALGMALLCRPANRETQLEKQSDHI